MEYVKIFLNFCVDVGMIIGPTSGYFFQYNLIRRTKSLGSFSTYTCAILIFSNILRIYFWFGTRFATALLLQSILMIVVQLFLLKECVQYKPRRMSLTPKYGISEKYKPKNFWRWDNYRTYIESIVYMTVFFGVLTFIFLNDQIYMEFIGYISVMIEACLGFPQLFSNWKNKSTAGLSMELILLWFTGACGKTLFFILNSQPVQFIICGFIQLINDIWILFQMYTYRSDGYEELRRRRRYDQFSHKNILMLHLLSYSDVDQNNEQHSINSDESSVWY